MTCADERSSSELDAPPSSRRGQAFPAASPLDDWSRFVDELAEARGEPEESGDFSSFHAAVAELSEGRPPSAPASEKTRVGPFGSTTERKIRTLDPREPSIEATRLDLFTVPAPPPAEPDVPPSYRTKVGLYYVPQEPATEPSLPEDVLDSIIRRPAPRSVWRRIVDFFTGR